MAEDEKSGSVFARWSERKAKLRRGEDIAEAEEAAAPDTAELAEPDQDEADAAISDEELLQEFDLPDPETVDDEEGLSRFFDGKVPDRLRQIALRRLWRINPLFAVVDDMVEYGEDYTDAATVVDGLQSAYQAGKGYMEKLAREAEAAKEAEEADALTGDDDSTGADAEESTDAAADPEETDSEEMANPEKSGEAREDIDGVSPENRQDTSADRPMDVAEDVAAANDDSNPPVTAAVGQIVDNQPEVKPRRQTFIPQG